MTEGNRYSGAHLILAFLAGAVTGVAGALLSAPQPGRETRDSLRGWAKDAQGQATRVPQALREAYHEAAGAAKKAFTDALKAEPAEAEQEEPKLTKV
jgi:gas vesicle protein